MVSGTSTALERLETTFNQDLNGDGVIGVPTANKPAISATMPNMAAVKSPSPDTFSFRQDMGAKAIDPSFSASTNNHFTTPPLNGLVEQPHSFFDAAHHDQAVAASGTNDQLFADVHSANLLAHHFFFTN